MKVLIEIPEEDYKTIKSGSQMVYSGKRSGKGFLIKMLSAVLSGTPIPDNATNLDVFSAIFKGTPDISICPIFCISKDDVKCQCDVDTCKCGDWWDAPYKGGE